MKLRAAVLVLLLGALAAAPAAAQPAASAPPSGTLDQAFAKAQADIQAVVAAINQALAQLNTDMTVLQAQIGNADKVLNTVSPAGTMVPGTATQIVDSTGAVWSFGPVAGADGNVILRNGVAQQGTQANLLYYDASGTVWQRNAHNLWWHWVNAAGQWQPNGGTLTSPIPAPPSNPPPSQSGNPPPPTAANVCGSSAPPQAAAAGFTHLDWSLDPHQPIDIGYSADGQAHTLYAGLWYEPYGSAANVVQDTANGVLKLLNYQNLSTIDKQGNGKTFNGGYFEVDGTGHDWFAFWLMSQLHAQNPNAQVASNPLTYTSELDIVEGDEGAPDDVVSTIHLDTVSPSSPVPDQQNANNVVNTGTPIEGVRHKIGALWLPDHVEIYLDGTKINSFPTYPSTNQNMMLNLSSQPGGVLNGPTVNPIEFDVNAVCVWTTK